MPTTDPSWLSETLLYQIITDALDSNGHIQSRLAALTPDGPAVWALSTARSPMGTGYIAIREGNLIGLPDTNNGLSLYVQWEQPADPMPDRADGSGAMVWRNEHQVQITGLALNGPAVRITKDTAMHNRVLSAMASGVQDILLSSQFMSGDGFQVTGLDGAQLGIVALEPRITRPRYEPYVDALGEVARGWRIIHSCYTLDIYD